MSSGFLDHWIHSLLLDADATNVPATVHDTARFHYRSYLQVTRHSMWMHASTCELCSLMLLLLI